MRQGRKLSVKVPAGVDGNSQIRISGELWTARPYDETEVIAPGEAVDIFEIRGATAYVHRIPSLGS